MSILKIKITPSLPRTSILLLIAGIIFSGTSGLFAAEKTFYASEISRIDDNSGDGKGGKGDAKNGSVLRVGDNRKGVEMRVIVQLPIARYAEIIHAADSVHLHFTVKDTYGSPSKLELLNLMDENALGIEFDTYHRDSSAPTKSLDINRQKGRFDADITLWAKEAVLNAKSMLTIRLQAELDTNALRGNGVSDHFWIEAEGDKAIRMVVVSPNEPL